MRKGGGKSRVARSRRLLELCGGRTSFAMVDKMGRVVCARVGALLNVRAHILQASLRQERHKSVELERQLGSSQGCGWNSSMGARRLALTSSSRRGIANFPPEKVLFFCSQVSPPYTLHWCVSSI